MAESGNQFLMSEPGGENHGTQVESNEAYLNIIFVEGLVTRNGGACTYGSKQIRNLMMQAKAAGLVKDRWEMRAIVAKAFSVKEFQPKNN